MIDWESGVIPLFTQVSSLHTCVVLYSYVFFHIIIDALSAPSNLTIAVLNKEESALTVNLTWFQENSLYVVVYYVEVTAININITNMTATSQHITLTLQIGVEYSFRVRGADSINRLGEWSDYFVYPSKCDPL